jgi:hypothetical protein
MDLVENRIAFQEDDNTVFRGRRGIPASHGTLRLRQDDYMAAMIGRTLRACGSLLENVPFPLEKGKK